jgi:hypothetical protein
MGDYHSSGGLSARALRDREPEEDFKCGDLPLASIGRCLSGPMEISWRVVYVAPCIKKPLKGYYRPLRGFIKAYCSTTTFSSYSPEESKLG